MTGVAMSAALMIEDGVTNKGRAELRRAILMLGLSADSACIGGCSLANAFLRL